MISEINQNLQKIYKDRIFMIYDVIVIGAGPAGLMAARTLSKNKINFLVIEKSKELGFPLRCGECIREKEFLNFFEHTDYPFVKNTACFQKVMYRDLERTLELNLLELDRPLFEQWLAQPFQSNIKLNTRCQDLNINNECVKVITDKGAFEAKLVILTYGSNFNIQKKYGLIGKKPAIGVAYGGIYQNHKHKLNTFYYYFHASGYFWIFPKDENIANIGFGAFKSAGKTNVKKIFDQLVTKITPEAKLIKSLSGRYPCSGPNKKTYYHRMLICGNAAGQVHAGIGEGIYYALEAGKIAGEVALKAITSDKFNQKFLKQYEKAWQKKFGNEMKAGIIFSDLFELCLKYDKVKSLLYYPSDKEIKGMILDGKIPFQAILAWRLCKLFNLINDNETKNPLLLKIVYYMTSNISISRG